MSFFNDDSIINAKRILSITLEYKNFSTDAFIDINVSHNANSCHLRNVVKIRGNDSLWVNGTLAKLKDVLDSVQSQNSFVRRYTWLIGGLIALGIGIIIFQLLLVLPTTTPTSNPPALFTQYPFLRYALQYLLSLGLGLTVGMLPTWKLLDVLHSLWPTMEIQIGPEHAFVERKRRNMMFAVFTVGIVPLALSLTYDILKATLWK